jgi:Zn-dependent protease with chaperone function
MQQTEAHFFDGLTAGRHEVHVALSDDRMALIITGDSLTGPLRWPLMDLRALADTADAKRLTLTRKAETNAAAPRDPARLVLLDTVAIDWLHRTRPSLFKADLHRGTWKKIGTYIGAAAVAAGLMLFVILPAMANTLAQIIPVEREIAFGKLVTAQMERVLGGSSLGTLRCDAPEGKAALQAMLDRLTGPQDMQYEISLQVFDHNMVNAFAAPGGQVVILRGLLDKAGGPDEVAGVLAHEIGHVAARDGTRMSLRGAGSGGMLTMILGDFTGGAALAFVGEHMISSAYSRDAETAADEFALNMLSSAGVSAEGFSTFFSTLDSQSALELPEYLSSHPVTADRAERARAFAEAQNDAPPILTDAEWTALKNICR